MYFRFYLEFLIPQSKAIKTRRKIKNKIILHKDKSGVCVAKTRKKQDFLVRWFQTTQTSLFSWREVADKKFMKIDLLHSHCSCLFLRIIRIRGFLRLFPSHRVFVAAEQLSLERFSSGSLAWDLHCGSFA